ncbi:MAG: substrate-binding domain-containing protein [Planctomycetaceae bacterium]|nr:substrate-binding domain-containing protein [Planctomycetaceae bacterium]
MKNSVLLALIFALGTAVAAPAGEQVHIGYSCAGFDDVFLSRVRSAAQAEASANNVKLTMMDAREKIDVQLQQIDQLLADQVDALLVVATDTEDVDDIVRMAKKAEVPLVFVNRNPFTGIRPPDDCFVISSSARVEGETQINYVGPKLDAYGHIVILQGILHNEATRSRTEGVKDVIMQSYPELAITAEAPANWQRDMAKVVMGEWIKAYGRDEIDAVLSNNDEMALGALDALETAGITDVLIMGVDANPDALEAIKAGRMTGTVLQDPIAQGRGGVQIALRALAGESQAQNFLIPSDLVTAENVDNYLNK